MNLSCIFVSPEKYKIHFLQQREGKYTHFWTPLFHPVFGMCFVFKLWKAEGMVGEDGPSSVLVTADLGEAAFPTPVPEERNNLTDGKVNT